MVSLRYRLRLLDTYSSLTYRKAARRHGGQRKRNIFSQSREWIILDVLARSPWQRKGWRQSCWVGILIFFVSCPLLCAFLILDILELYWQWPTALLYIIWNNGYLQPAMGYWLKSFNADPPPVPGKSYTVAQINNCEFVLGPSSNHK